MNFIKNIFSPAARGVSHAPQSAGSAASLGKSSYRAGLPVPSEADAFERKYSQPPYVTRCVWRGPIPYIYDRYPLSYTFLSTALEKSGIKSLIETKGFRDKHIELLGRHRTLQAHLEDHSYRNLTNRFLAQQADVEIALATGKDLPVISSREELEAQWQEIRKAIHAQHAAVAQETYEQINPVCLQLRDCARKQVEEMDAQERNSCSQFGVEFEPSPQLKAVVVFALMAAMQPVKSYLHESGFLVPLENIEDYWLNWTDPATRAPKVDRQITTRALYLHGDEFAEEQKLKNQARSGDPAAASAAREKLHQKQLIDINAFNDSIRLAPPK